MGVLHHSARQSGVVAPLCPGPGKLGGRGPDTGQGRAALPAGPGPLRKLFRRDPARCTCFFAAGGVSAPEYYPCRRGVRYRGPRAQAIMTII